MPWKAGGWAFVIAAMLALSHPTATDAAEQRCEAYSTYRLLPRRFVEIASGSLSAGNGNTGTIEFFIVSDGVCTCESEPPVLRRAEAVKRHRAWTCRTTTDDEKAVP